MTPLLLALLLARPAAAVDWNADPLASLRPQLTEIRSEISAPKTAPAPVALGGTAGSFDYYVLSLEWHPTFCAGRGSLPECQNPDYDRALVMHGLWPSQNGDSSNSYGYCGVDSNTRRLDTAQTRCQMPEVPLSQETRDALASKMPGTDACLERHEWFRHGTCSGLDAESYFGLADYLVTQANDSGLGRLISSHIGQTVSSTDLMNAARADWGDAADGAVHFICVRGALSEVRVTVSPSVQSLSGSLVPGSVQGSCPASFLITAGR